MVVTVPRRVDLSELFYQVAWQSLPPGAEIVRATRGQSRIQEDGMLSQRRPDG